MKKNLVSLSLNYAKIVLAIIGIVILIFLIQFPSITIDTDPENMLNHDETGAARSRSNEGNI